MVIRQRRVLPKWVKPAMWILLIAGLTTMLVLFLYLAFSYPLASYKKVIRGLINWLKGNTLFFPLIVPILTLLTFTFDRLVAARIRRKDARRNWYTKAFIDPNLKDIRVFFSSVHDEHKSSVKLLKQKKKYQIVDEQEYTLLKAKQTENIGALVRKLNTELVSVILVTNPQVALAIQEILQEVSSHCTEGIDKLNEDYDNLYEKLGDWQGKVMYILARPSYD